MRQRGDHAFSELLCRVRKNSCTSEDIKTLKSREITPNLAKPGFACVQQMLTHAMPSC